MHACVFASISRARGGGRHGPYTPPHTEESNLALEEKKIKLQVMEQICVINILDSIEVLDFEEIFIALLAT